MSLKSKFQQSRQYDTEGTRLPTDLDFSQSYTLWASNPWPAETAAVVPVGTRVFHQTRVFYTDGAYIDNSKTLKASEFRSPVVAFSFSSNPIANGAAITLDASATKSYQGGKIVNYAWDLDGDGVYETVNGSVATELTSYVPTHATATVLTTVGGDGSHNEVQTITLANAVGGTFTITYSGQTTTALAYNASSAAVQAALIALSNLGSGQITATGSAGGPYTCTFAGTLADTNVAQMTTTVTNLVEQSVTVGLQVTDDQGNVGTVSNVLSVIHG